ncbi:2-succinyl-6-hydroxy-2,4-cyclohexadiene-1-carboxylate synthase [Candidatus Marinamargulisbacteria bacterium SCGC AAA071-K20]|nr:2-succinyl-6-hydroxy-2,4-cyclohexadiene-1-carboxylate synthase [Candidatus Marinamargulisbacteria bacterium SCGC AAA071-K20]
MTTLFEPKKKTIVLVHGFMGSSDDWDSIIKLFEPISSCYTVDLPFHGKEQECQVSDFKELTIFLQSKLKNVPKPFTLIGYSLGGRVATHYALANPNDIQSLILESTNLGLSTLSKKNSRLKNDEVLAKELVYDYRFFLDHWYKKPLWGNIITNSNYSQLIDKKLEQSPQTLAKALITFSLGKQDYLLPPLIKSKIPTLLITGNEDKKYCTLASSYITKGRNLSHTIINGGHNTHFSYPNKFAEVCIKFFKEKKK